MATADRGENKNIGEIDPLAMSGKSFSWKIKELSENLSGPQET
jgi:hypothetical protein